jgi:hypothetical protein
MRGKSAKVELRDTIPGKNPVVGISVSHSDTQAAGGSKVTPLQTSTSLQPVDLVEPMLARLRPRAGGSGFDNYTHATNASGTA